MNPPPEPHVAAAVCAGYVYVVVVVGEAIDHGATAEALRSVLEDLEAVAERWAPTLELWARGDKEAIEQLCSIKTPRDRELLPLVDALASEAGARGHRVRGLPLVLTSLAVGIQGAVCEIEHVLAVLQLSGAEVRGTLASMVTAVVGSVTKAEAWPVLLGVVQRALSPAAPLLSAEANRVALGSG